MAHQNLRMNSNNNNSATRRLPMKPRHDYLHSSARSTQLSGSSTRHGSGSSSKPPPYNFQSASFNSPRMRRREDKGAKNPTTTESLSTNSYSTNKFSGHTPPTLVHNESIRDPRSRYSRSLEPWDGSKDKHHSKISSSLSLQVGKSVGSRPLSPIEYEANMRSQEQTVKRSASFSNLGFDQNSSDVSRERLSARGKKDLSPTPRHNPTNVKSMLTPTSSSAEYNPSTYTSDPYVTHTQSDVKSVQNHSPVPSSKSPDLDLSHLSKRTTLHTASSSSLTKHTSGVSSSRPLSNSYHTSTTRESHQPKTMSPKSSTRVLKHDERASSKGMTHQSVLDSFPKGRGRLGLGNLGNTCFMNSMLQCLGQTGEMASIFLNLVKPHSKPLVKAYCDLMQQMWGAGRASLGGSFYPRELKDVFSRKNPQFTGFNQHDSQEFMRFLVSSLHDDLKEQVRTKPSPPTEENPDQWWKWYRKLENSPLLDVFVGQLCSTLTCLHCQRSSKTFDPFWEISVSIPKNNTSGSYSTSHGASNVPLEDCLGVFTREETLDGDEQPYCGNCKSQRPGKKEISFQRLPQILIIHLKRFSSYGRRAKLDTSICIPHTLFRNDNSNFFHEYELYAVSNHSGSAYFGHYTAWCKHYSNSDQWFSYNDSQVSSLKVSAPTFSSSNAYVLFYRLTRRELKTAKVTAL